jgi:hypothetical protein
LAARGRHRIAALGLLATALCGGALGACPVLAAPSTPSQFRWLVPAPAPAGWKRLSLLSGSAVLSYPPSLRAIKGDHGSVSAAEENRSGRILLYLNATPQQGSERLATWPAFRLARIHDESSSSVHEDGQALDLSFLGGKGSCVIDDYVTHVKDNHYREIACFVRGATSGSVVVAAALASEWTGEAALLERAVAAYRVS